MSISLLDVNVLVALFDPAHINHEDAHRWFGRNRKHGWATCPITVNGCVRVLSNPSYPTVDAKPADVAVRNHGRLATFDKSIPLKAVQGAEPGHLVSIGSS